MLGGILRCLTLVAVGLLFSRGLLELALPKSIAAALQLLSIALFTALAFISSGSRKLVERDRTIIAIGLTLLVIAALSGLLTMIKREAFMWPFYFIFHVFLFYLAIVGSTLDPELGRRGKLGSALRCWGWILLAVALVEQVKFIEMPGSSHLFSMTRPASLTGSYLHYPIIMAILGYVAFQEGKKVSGTTFCLAPILALSRSGAFIVLFAGGIYALRMLFKGRPAATVLLLGVLLFLGAYGLSKEQSQLLTIVNRVTQAADQSASGNAGRIYSWLYQLERWSETNLLIGEYTGLVTNVSKTVEGESYPIAESGLIQQLVNFGLLGASLFYALLLAVYSRIAKDQQLLRSMYLACVVQSFFYQSIEVLPFITVILLMPWISATLALSASVAPQGLACGWRYPGRRRRLVPLQAAASARH